MSLVDIACIAVCEVYNQIHKVRPRPHEFCGSGEELRQIEQRVRSGETDISDYLVTLFAEAVSARPKLVVELGVRGGDSTFAFERAARLSDAHLLSVDMDDCSARSSYAKWSFVKQDDVAFAGEFAAWCSSRQLTPLIDVLFIDTCHLYEHTKEEFRVWLPYLAPSGKLVLHDTNMKRIYRRASGSLGAGWNNARGVIRALEEELGAKFNENRDFVTVVNGWIVRHRALCNGLTVAQRFVTA